MIKITNIDGAGEFPDGSAWKPLDKRQQQYVAKKIREALEEISVKAKVTIE